MPRRECVVAAPPNQYGPSEWIVAPDTSLNSDNTHASGAQGLVGSWLKHCGELARAGRPLNRNCARFGSAAQILRALKHAERG